MKLDALSAGQHPGGVLVAAALESAGITHTFGIPGTHNIELYDALAASRVCPVLVTDEQSAGFIADGMARSGGPISCANVVPGAGITHVLSGVAEAWMDNVPMLVLTCGIRTDTGHRFQLHDIDQVAILRPVCKRVWRIEDGRDIPRVVLEAVALARSGCPGPVAIEVPANVYLTRHAFDPADLVHLGVQITRAAPDPDQIERVAALLSTSRSPLLHLGMGAADAASLLVPLAERMGAMVSTTISGKGVFPESHPLWLWPGFGRSCPPPLRRLADAADGVLIIGARMGEVSTGSYGLQLPHPAVQVDIDGSVPGANFDVDLAVVSDAALFVSALLAHMDHQPWPPRDVADRTRRIDKAHRAVDAVLGKPGQPSRVPPAALFGGLQQVFPHTTRYTTDSGKGTFLAMEHLRLDTPRHLLAPTDFSCMGYALPAAIGAAMAHPGDPVVALVGDGAMLMTGLELLTAQQHKLPIAVVVLVDGELGQISAFQRAITNRPVCTVLEGYDLAAFAGVAGVPYWRVQSTEALPAVLDAARSALADGPVLIGVDIDYSRKTFFAKGVIHTNLGRLPWRDRVRMVGRIVARRATG
jgi:acetolactate synthase-1/2/3 large subunit